ncbi:hypothetical protein [Streptosporangium sp. CA-115845]|uniref:hypothetical protein n=1 Tax=Streptosporangium sp. CA-115845 TaxID=3240071 RepID=UPI003D8FA0C9
MDDNVHNPDTCCPGEASTTDTVGLEVSTRPACHSDHGPDTAAEVDTRTRQRINQPSFSLPEATAGACNQHVLTVEHPLVDRFPVPDQINPDP